MICMRRELAQRQNEMNINYSKQMMQMNVYKQSMMKYKNEIKRLKKQNIRIKNII